MDYLQTQFGIGVMEQMAMVFALIVVFKAWFDSSRHGDAGIWLSFGDSDTDGGCGDGGGD